MNSENPFFQHQDFLNSRQRVKAVFMDFFPVERIKANTLMIAYDAGIVASIKARTNLDDAFALRFIKVLTSEYAMQNQMAIWAVRYWIEMYGKQTLGKTACLSDELVTNHEVQANAPLVSDSIFSPSSQHSSQTSLEKKIEELNEGEKLPKSIINIQTHSFTGVGINKITCAVRKGYTSEAETCMKIAGEYEGKTSNKILLVFMCFNSHNELIGSVFDSTISNDFEGTATYTTQMYVPKWESIQRIEVRATLDPAMLW